MATRPARAAAVRPPLIGLGRVFVVPESPSPRETRPRRESNEESPESRRLFGAVWGAQPQRTPRGKHSKANAVTQKRTLPRRLLRSPFPPFSAFPRPFVLRRDRHKETYTPEVNRQSSITISTIRERATSDPDPRRNRNGTSRKPSCLAHRRQTAGVIERKTFRQERMTGVNRAQPLESPAKYYIYISN